MAASEVSESRGQRTKESVTYPKFERFVCAITTESGVRRRATELPGHGRAFIACNNCPLRRTNLERHEDGSQDGKRWLSASNESPCLFA